jgi:hypothetical protein
MIEKSSGVCILYIYLPDNYISESYLCQWLWHCGHSPTGIFADVYVMAKLLISRCTRTHFFTKCHKKYIFEHFIWTEYKSSLNISNTPTLNLRLPSLPIDLKTTCIDFFLAKAVVPANIMSVTAIPHLPRVAHSKAPIMTCAMMHQCFGRIYDDLVDRMCKEKTLSGIPRVPPPRYAYDFPVYRLGTFPQFKKGKTVTMEHIKPGELVHINFDFWNIVSRRGLTAVLTIVDACSRFIWLLCTASKKLPIRILRWFIANICCEDHTLAQIRVYEDGALTGSSLSKVVT